MEESAAAGLEGIAVVELESAVRTGLVLAAAGLVVGGALSAPDPPAGARAVEALLKICSDAGVIVSESDSRTGSVPQDPKLGISKFIVPDETKLRAILKANQPLMADEKSRQALIGCAKLAARKFAPGWVDLLRAVGRELDDGVSVRIAYEIAAALDLPLGSRQGFADLKLLINKLLEAGAVEYHAPKSNGLAWLTIRDETKFQSLLEANRALLGPGLIGAAANMSQTRCDHAPILKAIARMTNDLAATAYGAEYAARSYQSELNPRSAAAELELAAKSFAAMLDFPSQARIWTQLGEVRREFGEDERALALFDDAYSILTRVHDGKHRDLANLHRLRAELYCDRNEVQRALMAYMKAVTMFLGLSSNDKEFTDTSNMMRLMARIDLNMGHGDDAREKLIDVLFVLGEIDRKRLPDLDTAPHRALAFRDLGQLELRRDRYDEAKQWLDRALDLQMKREGAVHPETIKTLLLLGQACAARDEPGQSEFFTRQATIFLMRHHGAKHPALIKAWSDRSAVLAARGDFRGAGEEIAIGLKAARISESTDRPTAEDYLPTRDTVLLLARRGELSLRAADRSREPTVQLKTLRYARDHFELAEGVFNRIRGNMPGDADRLMAGDAAPDFFLGQLACHVRLQKLEAGSVDSNAAFLIAERATARSLLETMGDEIASRLAGVPDELRARHRQLRMNLESTLREHNASPFQHDQTRLSPEQSATWEKHLQAQRALQEFGKSLAEKYPTSSRETGVSVCTPEQALASLGPNEVAVTFLLGAKESFAIVLGRSANRPEVTVHALPARETLDNQIATLIDPSVMDQAMGRQIGEDLHDQLLEPLGQVMAGKDLVIVPTGPLCRLPFELLRSRTVEGRQYLGVTHRIRYLPSLTVSRLLQERDRTRLAKPDLPLWAMANSEHPTLPSLPRAASEAKTIAAILNAEAADVRIGPAATKHALLAATSNGELKRRRILHFAVHAGFASETNWTPGLMLTGHANQSGFLDMDEIAHLDLNAELVVLSACSSGGGRIYGGEGIRGLTSSFLVAGARAVIATQWPLADAGAAQFMEAFYRRLQAGAKPADALWEARRSAVLQAEPRPPSEWAAYILIGN